MQLDRTVLRYTPRDVRPRVVEVVEIAQATLLHASHTILEAQALVATDFDGEEQLRYWWSPSASRLFLFRARTPGRGVVGLLRGSGHCESRRVEGGVVFVARGDNKYNSLRTVKATQT